MGLEAWRTDPAMIVDIPELGLQRWLIGDQESRILEVFKTYHLDVKVKSRKIQ